MPRATVDRRNLGRKLAAMDEADCDRVLNAMFDTEHVSLAEAWVDWAAPSQSPPDGDWRTWLLMAGRGFGKTRAGAEWVRGIAEAGDRGTRIALVAASEAEARAVMVEADARGWPVAFLYKAGTAVTRLAAEDARGAAAVIHVKTAHPLDDHYGLGCLGAAAGAIAIHNAATRWNKALLDNAARPSGALVYEPGEPGAVLAAEQFTRLRAELDASFSGAGNAGRPMLLEGGLKWQSLSLSPADMDFVGLKAAAAREIALAFGVPPMLLGLPGDATYANYREANKALWRLSVLPMAGLILEGIAQGLRPHFAGLTLAVDPDRVSALSEDRERLWAQVSAADFLTLNEKREAVGRAPIKVPAVAPSVEPKPDTKVPMPEPAPLEVKFNPWHDPDDGKFTFSEQGVRHGAGKGERRGAGVARKPSATTAKPVRRQKVADYFSPTVKPTIENALAQIRVSKFGRTQAGQYVIEKIERLHKSGKVKIADLGGARGKRTSAGEIFVDFSMAKDVNWLASELVHEATHDLLSDEYRRTKREPNGNSIEQELLTNGYQLQLYREQRKYGRPDRELEERLSASNTGKLRTNIRKRYPTAPDRQP